MTSIDFRNILSTPPFLFYKSRSTLSLEQLKCCVCPMIGVVISINEYIKYYSIVHQYVYITSIRTIGENTCKSIQLSASRR